MNEVHRPFDFFKDFSKTFFNSSIFTSARILLGFSFTSFTFFDGEKETGSAWAASSKEIEGVVSLASFPLSTPASLREAGRGFF